MEETQLPLKNENEDRTQPHYRLIYSNTGVGFLNLLNKNYEDGYRLDKDTLQFREVIDCETGVKVTRREAYLYNHEDTGLDTDETSKRMQIINLVNESESWLYGKKSLLEDRQNWMLLNVNWDKVNEDRQERGLTKISNEKSRTAFMNEDKQLRELKEDVQEAEQYLKLVKKYAELHELPNTNPPWELEEKEAIVQDEKASQVKVEKVKNSPNEPKFIKNSREAKEAIE